MDKAQRQLRQTGLSGQDISSILGRNPWGNPLTVYAHKVETLSDQDDPGTEAMQTGTAFEPWLATQYQARHDIPALKPNSSTFRHPKCAIALATPDGFLFKTADLATFADLTSPQPPTSVGLWEAKTTGIVGRPRDLEVSWGPEGSDDIPEHLLIEAQWRMGVCMAEMYHLSALIGGRGYAEFIIQADPELWGMLRERAEAWWDAHIIKATPPLAIDGNEQTRKAIDQIYRRVTKDKELLESTPEIDALAEAMKAAADAHDAAEADYETQANAIRQVIGPDYGIKGTWGKILWPQSKDGTRIDKDGLIEELTKHVPVELATALALKHTKPAPGYRRLMPYWRTDK